MQDGDVDYSRYGLAELQEALEGIDRHKYPRNYANLCTAYHRLAKDLPPPRAQEQEPLPWKTEPPWPGPKFDRDGRYVPNDIPSEERILHIVLSLLLLAYGSYGVWINDLYVPGKRRGMHLHDVPAWIMYGAIICACMVMLSVVIDHYDRRNNERRYRAFAQFGEYLGWTFFAVSLVWGFFNEA